MFLTFNDPKNTAGPRVGSHLLRSSRGLAENQKTHPTKARRSGVRFDARVLDP
jgi:hypothetical protein